MTPERHAFTETQAQRLAEQKHLSLPCPISRVWSPPPRLPEAARFSTRVPRARLVRAPFQDPLSGGIRRRSCPRRRRGLGREFGTHCLLFSCFLLQPGELLKWPLGVGCLPDSSRHRACSVAAVAARRAIRTPAHRTSPEFPRDW